MINIDSHEEELKRADNAADVDASPGQPDYVNVCNNGYEEQYNANQDFAIFQPKD